MSRDTQAELWDIVRTVAKTSSVSEVASARYCPFCNGVGDYGELSQPDGVFHEETCIVARARKLVEETIK